MPDLWIADAIQDLRILLWQHPDRDDVMVIRSGCIDAARRYGPRSRWGVERNSISLEEHFTEDDLVAYNRHSRRVGAKRLPKELWAHDDGPQTLNIEALKRELPKLSHRWQDALYHSVMKEHQSNNEEQAAAKAKRRLRQRCA